MMIVVMIIGLFAALAAPSISSLVRDQRTRREAYTLVDTFRQARARSLGRGSAVNVNFNINITATTQSDVVTKEATTANVPDPNCRTFNWPAATVIAHVQPGASSQGAGVQVTATIFDKAMTATATPYADVCYTPSGRIFTRNAPAGVWSLLTGRVELSVQRIGDPGPPAVLVGQNRIVQINGDGTTQLKL